jgi:hypothetical protein
MAAREIFDKLLNDVVASTAAIAAEEDQAADWEFFSTAFAVLGLALSRLPPAKREKNLQAIEDGGALRRAVEMYPNVQQHTERHALH